MKTNRRDFLKRAAAFVAGVLLPKGKEAEATATRETVEQPVMDGLVQGIERSDPARASGASMEPTKDDTLAYWFSTLYDEFVSEPEPMPKNMGCGDCAMPAFDCWECVSVRMAENRKEIERVYGLPIDWHDDDTI